MSKTNSFTHLTLEERRIIATGIENESSKTAIVETIGKEKSTIGKEACQKGSLENKHVELRYILPKKTDLRNLGLTDQDALNLVLSHVNSAPVEKLGGKSPLELAEFLYPDLIEALNSFGIYKIEKDRVVLKPYLLK